MPLQEGPEPVARRARGAGEQDAIDRVHAARLPRRLAGAGLRKGKGRRGAAADAGGQRMNVGANGVPPDGARVRVARTGSGAHARGRDGVIRRASRSPRRLLTSRSKLCTAMKSSADIAPSVTDRSHHQAHFFWEIGCRT